MIELREALQVLAADRLSRRRRLFARDEAALALWVAESLGVVGVVALVVAAMLADAGVL